MSRRGEDATPTVIRPTFYIPAAFPGRHRLRRGPPRSCWPSTRDVLCRQRWTSRVRGRKKPLLTRRRPSKPRLPDRIGCRSTSPLYDCHHGNPRGTTPRCARPRRGTRGLPGSRESAPVERDAAVDVQVKKPSGLKGAVAFVLRFAPVPGGIKISITGSMWGPGGRTCRRDRDVEASQGNSGARAVHTG